MKLVSALVFSLFASFAVAEVEVGKPAPSFSEKAHDGKTYSLNELKGDWIVLEWYNEGCPYVEKHYGSKNMQQLQKQFTNKGVKWFSVATSAKGKQGYVDPKKAVEKRKAADMQNTALLLDSDGTMGRSYGAKTTPHMFVINPKGNIVYAGAIDSNSSANPKTIEGATNYVVAALESAMNGKAVSKTSTKPYGCSVKY